MVYNEQPARNIHRIADDYQRRRTHAHYGARPAPLRLLLLLLVMMMKMVIMMMPVMLVLIITIIMMVHGDDGNDERRCRLFPCPARASGHRLPPGRARRAAGTDLDRPSVRHPAASCSA